MADQLYLSLWFPNFRFEALPAALVSVLRQFALISGEKRVAAASVYPISFTEAPTYQRIYVNDDRAQDSEASIIENAVAEATEQLHDDMAYEFEMKWKLWMPESDGAGDPDAALDALWKLQPSTVRILGFGPTFDDASYEQNGHIRIDFGLDTPWIMDETVEDSDLDELAQKRIQQNIEMLLAFTLSVEKHCGISSRLLWTESGEPLAEKLIARLQRLN
ncbi:hypothetical protein [Edaphobacter dinghuensis]|uniref:Uncharacterized protein n=1 Tax=Edaphobacter dinghuensis TaxID=1560005 RepID=A0A917M3D4_9BACT|nr:hypothetical protein [Edaphobacter dinghuensis]GGG76671.1 hypothetical protein GCM10011585_19510 [Edaphobacter dinghuensis]